MNRLLPLFAVLALAGCKKPEAAPEKPKATALPPVAVETAAVTHEKMPRLLTLTGSVIPDRQSEVAANVSGRVTATYVERGMPVKAGQVMAVVDSKAAGYQAAAAMAQSQAAQTQVNLARQECDRADTLFGQGAIPKSEYDRLKTQCTSQLYQANAAQANADLAGKLAGDTIIRAPIDGIVGERYVNVGEYVQPPTRVASVYSVNPARISISVPEPAVGRIQVGQALDIEVSSWPDRTFPATVRFVGPALRTQTRDLIIEAVAKNDDLALKPGMFATVKLVVGEEELPTVPLDAIKTDGTVRRLFVAQGSSVVELVVKTGLTKDGRIAVIEPLAADARVVVRPPPGLSDGAVIAAK
ncbi:MAG: efflux RND transporter periplasmic adaptor subunit [Myxococcaceae bacterium]|nr:efflux RND transporter periplasmic adaptor subunit [Myxococcaceae bacterium]